MDLHLVSLAQEPAAWGGALAALHAADRADGLLLLTFLGLEPEHVAPLEEAGVPYVLVNRHFGERPAHCVTVDYGGANERLVAHMVGLGHRRLALLAPAEDSSTVRDHVQGWRRGLQTCGIAEEDAPVVRFRGAHHEAGLEVGERLLAEGLPSGRGRPTAIVGFNDFVAHGMLRAAARLGVAVPDELSVIGFNNLVARYTSPPLCSHEFHLPEVGAAAVSLLAAVMRGEVREPTRRTIEPAFVCRGSCGPAPV
jgi:LacI family transcriptional regulator